VVNLPARGLGEKGVAAVIDLARRNERSFLEEGTLGAPGADLNPKARAALEGFCRPLLNAQSELAGADLEDDVSDICARAIYAAGIESLLDREKDLKRRERISDSVEEVVRALFAWTGRLLDARENPDLAESWVVDTHAHPVSSFLDRVALEEEEREKARQKKRENQGEQKRDDRVTLMSLHRSKGLEFPVVYVVGFEEGLLPHRRSIEEGGPEAIEEERRLCYVGITRAQLSLTFTWSKARRRRKIMVPRALSRFATELPDEVANQTKEVEPPDQETAAAGFFAQMRGQFSEPDS
jgi:superfamily I DNA/RNA helicase